MVMDGLASGAELWEFWYPMLFALFSKDHASVNGELYSMRRCLLNNDQLHRNKQKCLASYVSLFRKGLIPLLLEYN